MKKIEKLYHVEFEEHNGEQSYSHDHLIKAENLEEAKEITKEYLKGWYDDEDVQSRFESGLIFEFFGGSIIVDSVNITETTPAEYAKRIVGNTAGTDVEDWNWKALDVEKPTIIVTVDGGRVDDVISNVPVDVHILDGDIDQYEYEEDPEKSPLVNAFGCEYFLRTFECEDPTEAEKNIINEVKKQA